jgi:hypothetical protein
MLHCTALLHAHSGDHGPFNSWDRQPFLTTVRDGKTPSLRPKTNTLSRNFVMANYDANGGCFDNDDGSAWYDITENVCCYGGHKSTNGFGKRTFANLNIFPQVYGPACAGMFGLPRATADGEFNEGYFNNTCIVGGPSAVYFKVWEPMASLLPGGLPNASAHASANQFPVTTHSNRLYGNLSVCAGAGHITGCDGTAAHWSMEQWLALGLDPGTEVVSRTAPNAIEILELAKSVLRQI